MENWTLSPFERTCLRWISRHRTVAEIALLEGKTVTDIENCLESALAAWNVRSLAEALEKTRPSD
jgi:DNA-binding CsgD family transcriptional regulator